MALPSSYNTGTASVSNGSTAVTGQGTNWLTSGLQAGDIFVAGGMQAEIASVNSNTSITLADTWPGANRTGDTYRARFVGDMTRGLTAMNAVLSSITNGILYALSQLASAANKIAYFTGSGTMALADFTAHARAFTALSGGAGKFFRSTGANTGVMQDIVGTVSQSGGVPTGAIVERGSNANGEYVKFADGTLICTKTVTIDTSDVNTQTYRMQLTTSFAAAFAVAPHAYSVNVPLPTGTYFTNITGTQNGRQAVRGSGAAVGPTAMTITIYFDTGAVNVSTSVISNVTIMAIGRWF
ncbi:hypothetical protein [Shinella sp.]|uniref:hypothetical protein n=1 Tax=Shinella sp. TaxID=1870904 RepID=UPI0028A9F2C4|nr:hypothetical protein [Shinella sp.]